MEEDINLLLHYVSTTLGLNRIRLEVFSNNTPAIAIYRTCGFYEVSESDGLKKMVGMRK